MTISTHHTPPPCADATTMDRQSVDMAAIAAAVLDSIAYRMQRPEPEVARALARTSWTTIPEMIAREFAGSYRRYYPKCDMAIRDEAVIAEAFDLITIAFEDPRRAVRCGAWTPPAARAGGRSDG